MYVRVREWVSVCVSLGVIERESVREWLGFAGATSRRSGRFEWNLQNTVTQSVTVEWLNGDEGFVVVGHGDKPKSFALVCLQIANDFDALNGTKRAEQLPQDALFGVRRQVIDKNAPTCSFIKFKVDICEFQTGFIHCGTLYTVPGMAAPAAAAAAAAAAPGSNGEAKMSPANGENLPNKTIPKTKKKKHFLIERLFFQSSITWLTLEWNNKFSFIVLNNNNNENYLFSFF